MSTYQQMTRVRARKLGLLIHDARIARNRSTAHCAKAMGISEDGFNQIEAGLTSPSLPQLESLAFYLDVPLEQFWGTKTLSDQENAEPEVQTTQYTELRHKIIGTRLRIARSNLNLTLAELAKKTGIPENLIKQYEMGETPAPLPELEILANALEVRMEELFDQRGPIGQWRAQKMSIQEFLQLPEEMREFLCKPVNLPYIHLAIRLSDLSVEKLRSVAEGLLEITY